MYICLYNSISNTLHIKLGAGHFVISKVGSLCHENSRHPLMSKDECFRAFATFRYLHYVNFVTVDKADWPKGCYARTKSHYIYWNTHHTGKKNKNAGEICYSYRMHFSLRHIFENLNIYVNIDIDIVYMYIFRNQVFCLKA